MIICKCDIVVVFLNRLCLVVVEIFYNTSPGLISFYTISAEGTAVLNQQLIWCDNMLSEFLAFISTLLGQFAWFTPIQHLLSFHNNSYTHVQLTQN